MIVRMIITTFYGFVSILIYIAIVIVIVKYRKTDFKNIFYTLFLILGILNIVGYLLNFVSLHIPEYLTEHSAITKYYETELSGFFAALSYIGTFHLNFTQLCLNLCIALNRFTCIVFFNNHETIWKYFLIPSLLISFMMPLAFTLPMMGSRCYFLFENGFVMLLSDYDLNLIYKQLTIFSCVIAVLMVFFSTCSIVRLRYRKIDSRHENSLFIVSFAICSIFVIDAVYLSMITYTTLSCEGHCSSTLWNLNIFLNLLIPYVTDAFCLLDPYLMLLINSRLRNKLLVSLRLKREQQKIVVFSEKLTHA